MVKVKEEKIIKAKTKTDLCFNHPMVKVKGQLVTLNAQIHLRFNHPMVKVKAE